MKTQKTIVFFAIALIAGIALTGSAQAFTEVLYGQVNHTEAAGQIATVWIDGNPSDYSAVPIRESDPVDYYFWDDIEPMLIRNGIGDWQHYNYTVAIFCSGTERNILGVMGDPYTNFIRNVTFLHGYGYNDGATEILPPYGTYWDVTLCKETFSKELGPGWNLISMPLTPDDSNTSAVLGGDSTITYDAVCRYNATSNEYESVMDGTMDPGTGYFVNVTSAGGMWTYSGAGYTAINEPLEAEKLNLIGWMNCNTTISGNLTSVAGNYNYISSWDATAQEFKTYNPRLTPDESAAFNDFDTMEKGRGYFFSMMGADTLDESC